MIDGSARRASGSGDPQPATVHVQAGDSDVTALADPAAGPDQEEVDVLYLAGQRLPDGGAWLLVIAADATPGGEFTAQVIHGAAASAFGGDVVVRLAADGPGAGWPSPAARAEVFAVMCGRLIPVGAWPEQNLDEWPERIRPAVAFAMSVLTELEEHDADLGARLRVDLAAAAAGAVPGIPLHLTFPASQAHGQPAAGGSA